MIKIKYLGFDYGWPDFRKSNPISKSLEDKHLDVDDINEAQIIVIGSFLSIHEFNSILNYSGKKILYLSEPVNNLQPCFFSSFIFKNKIYDVVTGCITNDLEKNWFKHSLYRISFTFNENIFNDVNRYVKETSLDKNYCALVNRHDWGDCRVKIYNRLIKYGKVDCPGVLLNNMSNEHVNRVGIPKFLNDYKFYICCENFGNSHPGYITEKLMGCCLGGAIPIYYGSLDRDDKEIFNEDRILFVDLNNLDGLENKVLELVNNREKFEQFYRQDVFKENAYEKLMAMDDNLKRMLKHIGF